jgi:hypothetical protein
MNFNDREAAFTNIDSDMHLWSVVWQMVVAKQEDYRDPALAMVA